MKPIYLVHEKHGTHIAYTEQEVELCKANGWKLRESEAVKPVVMEQVKRKYTRKAA